MSSLSYYAVVVLVQTGSSVDEVKEYKETKTQALKWSPIYVTNVSGTAHIGFLLFFCNESNEVELKNWLATNVLKTLIFTVQVQL